MDVQWIVISWRKCLALISFVMLVLLIGCQVQASDIKTGDIRAAGPQTEAAGTESGGQAVFADTSAGRKTVRVGYYEDNNGFQMGFSDNARKSGYAYEYYQEIAKYAGWQYKYVYGPWSDLYEKLLSGEIDIMAGVSKTHDRAGKMLYPDNVMGTESYYVFVPTNSSDIKNGDISTLNHKNIGVNSSSLMLTLFRRFVKNNGLDCEIKTYDGHFSCAAALEKGEIDGYVITDNYVVEGVKPVLKIGASNIYFAIAKGRSDLLSDINDAQNQILAASPYYTTYLQAKYFDHSVLRQALTDKEMSWLKEKSSLRVGCIDGQLPYSGTDASGNYVGVIRQLQESLSEYTSIPVDITAYPGTEELIAALKAGEIDAAFPIYDDTWYAEQNGIYLTKSVISDRIAALYTGAYDTSLLEKTAAAKTGISQEPYLAQYYPDSVITRYPDLAACVKALEDGKVTSVILDNNLIQRYLSEQDDDTELHVAYLDSPSSFCIAVSGSGTVLQSILNKAVSSIDSSSLTDAITQNTYGSANYSFGSFIRHNMVLVISLFTGIVLLLCGGFFIYRKKSIANRLQLMEASRAKSDFLSRMSHDIRTPMNAIINLTAMAQDELDNPGQLGKDLSKIAVSSEFLLGLINDILDMSRIESNKMVLCPGVYQFSEFESYLDGVIRPLCSQKDISLDVKMPAEATDILVDRIRFNQIFFNILSNSVKYTDPGGHIRFVMEISHSGPDAVSSLFTISDNGIGMSEEFLKHAYQPFERADNTMAYSGTGLGLSITKSIVEAMHGTIGIRSTLGEGTTVTVSLPLKLATQKQCQEYADAGGQEKPERPSGYAELNGMHVLIAEDNSLNLEIVTRLLKAEGVITDSASNGVLCLEAFKKSKVHYYDAILMDIRMPEMNGLEAAMHIRSLSRADAKTVPIVALTANALAADQEECYAAGMTAHLAKPVNSETLYNILLQYTRCKGQKS